MERQADFEQRKEGNRDQRNPKRRRDYRRSLRGRRLSPVGFLDGCRNECVTGS